MKYISSTTSAKKSCHLNAGTEKATKLRLSKPQSKWIISAKQDVCILRLNCLWFSPAALLNFLVKCFVMQKQRNTWSCAQCNYSVLKFIWLSVQLSEALRRMHLHACGPWLDMRLWLWTKCHFAVKRDCYLIELNWCPCFVFMIRTLLSC